MFRTVLPVLALLGLLLLLPARFAQAQETSFDTEPDAAIVLKQGDLIHADPVGIWQGHTDYCALPYENCDVAFTITANESDPGFFDLVANFSFGEPVVSQGVVFGNTFYVNNFYFNLNYALMHIDGDAMTYLQYARGKYGGANLRYIGKLTRQP